ncbi:MAG: M56 family metallopeptidase [Longimicrobiales bacterium]
MNRTAEARRRLLLKAGIAVVAAAAMVPVLLHEGSSAALLAQCEAIVRQCLQALLRLNPLEWLAAGLLAGGLVYAVADFARQQRRVRRVVRRHRTRPPRAGEPIHTLAVEHDALRQVRIIEGSAPNPAFAAGLLRPRLYVAATLQATLDGHQLRALFRHELWHVRRRDPLRFTLLRFGARFLVWLPIVGALADDLIEEAELMADDFAAEAEDPMDVAGALVRVARQAGRELALAPGARGTRPIERRVRRLLGEPVPTPPWHLRQAVVSLAALVVLWGAFASAPARAAQAPPHDVAQLHCPLCAEVGARGNLSHTLCHLLHSRE